MKILLGLSGGVDSAYAARKLMACGHDVEGATLVMHEHTEIADAERAARELGIPLHVIDCTDAFDKIVKADFVREYLNARTPNPCIICNERVKFARLYSYAMERGFDRIATGHYARVTEISDSTSVRYAVARAADTRKDQSYMLYRLSQKILSRLVLPLGDITKEDVRRLAAEQGISAADKRDSQEICFLPDGNYAEYIESVAGICPEGDFIAPDGRFLGKHKGIIRYTVGQRKGLGISMGERVFVTAIDPVANTVTLSPSLSGSCVVELSDAVYSGIAPRLIGSAVPLKAKLRYTAPLVECEAELRTDGAVTLRFAEPQKAAAGQSAVLYDGDIVALGGIING